MLIGTINDIPGCTSDTCGSGVETNRAMAS